MRPTRATHLKPPRLVDADGLELVSCGRVAEGLTFVGYRAWLAVRSADRCLTCSNTVFTLIAYGSANGKRALRARDVARKARR